MNKILTAGITVYIGTHIKLTFWFTPTPQILFFKQSISF